MPTRGRFFTLIPVFALAAATLASAPASHVKLGSRTLCPLKGGGVSPPNAQYVGKTFPRKGTANFSVAELIKLSEASYGPFKLCFGVSSDGKRLLKYASPVILLCPDGSAEFSWTSVAVPRVATIRKNGTFSVKSSSSSFFKGKILGVKATGTLREKQESNIDTSMLCDTGVVSWTARR